MVGIRPTCFDYLHAFLDCLLFYSLHICCRDVCLVCHNLRDYTAFRYYYRHYHNLRDYMECCCLYNYLVYIDYHNIDIHHRLHLYIGNYNFDIHHRLHSYIGHCHYIHMRHGHGLLVCICVMAHYKANRMLQLVLHFS